MEDILRIEREGALVRMTMQRPAKRNALNSDLVDALYDALKQAESDNNIRVIILAAKGSVFCAGADFKEFVDQTDSISGVSEKRSKNMGRLFQMAPVKTKPIIAVVDGPALGGGSALAIACDIVIASNKAKFGYPEIKGGFTIAGVLPLLVRHIGLKAAFDLASTGRSIDAEEAKAMGLVTYIVDSDCIMLEAERIGNELAGYSSDALSIMKQIVTKAGDLSLDEAINFARTVNGAGKE